MDDFKRAVYPGSFDLVTYGHLEIIKRSSSLFDEVIVAIGDSPKKEQTLTQKDRVLIVKSPQDNTEELVNVRWIPSMSS